MSGPAPAVAASTRVCRAGAVHDAVDLPPARSASRLGTLWFRLLTRCARSSLLSNGVRRVLLGLAGLRLDATAGIAHGCFVGGPDVRLGRHAYVNTGAFLDGSGPITIGDYARLGPLVRVVTSAHRVRRSPVRRWPSDPTIGMPVVVERGCWIGTGATLLPGVVVREGCIVGAGAVVTQGTEPHGLYVGVPAVRVKDLPLDEPFDEALVQAGLLG